MNALNYLLEANVYLAVWYGFYRLVLHRHTFFSFNRWFLLAAVVLSFSLPLLQSARTTSTVASMTYTAATPEGPSGIRPAKISGRTESPENVLLMVYGSIVLLSFCGTLRGIYRVRQLYGRCARVRRGGITYLELDTEQEAFSFLNWLFYHPETASIAAAIEHERVHIRQKHTLDVLFFELISAICWFNPVIYLMKKSVRLNHEYLADDYASEYAPNRYDYAMMLIHHACEAEAPALLHTLFNEKQLEMRIKCLDRSRSTKAARWNYLLVLPLLAGLCTISAFSIRKDYGLVTIGIGQFPVPASAHNRGQRSPSPGGLTAARLFGEELRSDKKYDRRVRSKKTPKSTHYTTSSSSLPPIAADTVPKMVDEKYADLTRPDVGKKTASLYDITGHDPAAGRKPSAYRIDLLPADQEASGTASIRSAYGKPGSSDSLQHRPKYNAPKLNSIFPEKFGTSDAARYRR